MDGIDRFREVTGLPIAPYFSASKILWLLENVPGLREAALAGQAVFGTVDTWLIYNLTGAVLLLFFVLVCGGVVGVFRGMRVSGKESVRFDCRIFIPNQYPTNPTTPTGGAQHITDVTNASRTMLMDIETLEWDEGILATLGIPRAMLPAIKSSSEVYGTGVDVLEGVRLAGASVNLSVVWLLPCQLL